MAKVTAYLCDTCEAISMKEPPNYVITKNGASTIALHICDRCADTKSLDALVFLYGVSRAQCVPEEFTPGDTQTFADDEVFFDGTPAAPKEEPSPPEPCCGTPPKKFKKIW